MEQPINQSQRGFKASDKPDIFVNGLTGSGKDTVANYFKGFYDYRVIRAAGTIKQIICEKFGITHEELEVRKRTEPELREEHHIQSAYLGNQVGSLNRCKQIAEHNSFDLQLCNDPEKQLAVCDGRTFEEAEIFLEEDFIGIFLARTTSEYKNAQHFTEKNMFENGDIIRLSERYAHLMLLVFNDSDTTKDEVDAYLSEFVNKPDYLFIPNATKEELLDAIDAKFVEWQPGFE